MLYTIRKPRLKLNHFSTLDLNTYIGEMNTIRLTPSNVHLYIGNEIIFTSRNIRIVKRIIGVSNTGKTIHIDHPDLQNSLQIVSRKVHAIV